MRDELNKVTKDVLAGLSEEDQRILKEDLYYLGRYEHTKEDVFTQFEQDERTEGLSEEELNSLAGQCAYRYTYEGDYDCNLNYWTNIQNLIDEELEHMQDKEKG